MSWGFLSFPQKEMNFLVIEEWAKRRSLEILLWPIFISQPIVPIFLSFYPFPILVALFFLSLIWAQYCNIFPNVKFSNIASLFVKTKWPAALIFGYIHLNNTNILWPILTMTYPFIAFLEMALITLLFPDKIDKLTDIFIDSIIKVPKRPS